MKIMYLGTAAAEGFPALFCHCENCKTARERGGRNIRTRSQAIVDGKILIDFPADAYMHVINNKLDFSDISTLLVTHVHPDHLYPDDFGMRRRGYAHLDGGKRLNIYGSQDIVPLLEVFKAPESSEVGPEYINICPIEPYKTFTVEDDYSITAIEAVHGTPHPYCYIINHDGKTMLYAHDTSSFREPVWKWMQDSKLKLDFVSMDCTEAMRNIGYEGHMNLKRDIEFRRHLIDEGIADEKTIFCMNHISHNGTNGTYEEMLVAAEENGLLVSYDGMVIEF